MKIRVVGDSMGKMPRVIEIIPIRNCTFADVKVGDIVSYHSRGYDRNGIHKFWYLFGEHVVHRIIEKRETYAIIKGDNRKYTEQVPYSKIDGKVKGFKQTV